MIITHNGTILTNDGVVLNNIITSPSFINTYSLDFDGMDDYVDCGILPNIPFSGMSYSMWFKSSDVTRLNRLMGYRDVGIDENAFYTYTNGGKVGFGILYGTLGTFYESTSNTISPNTWYHIVVVYDGSLTGKENTMKIYVNGLQLTSLTGNGGEPTSTLTAPTTNLSIGGWYTNGFPLGNIDEPSVFNYALSQQDITTIYNGGTPTDLTPLNPIAWYRMGDNGAYKDPQWLIPSNENKDKVSNYSMEFDGMDDYINIADNTIIGRTQNISYSVWVNLQSTTVRQYIVGNFQSSNFGTGLALETIGGNALVFQIGDGTNDSFFNSRVSNFSTLVPPNTWSHILATWDGTDAKIYINGNLENTWSPTTPYSIIGWSSFWIARRGDSPGSNLVNGLLNECSLFNTAISISDVWDGSGKPKNVSGVLGITNYWRLGEEATFTYNTPPNGTWNIPDQVGSNPGTSVNLMVDSARVGTAPSSSNNAVSFNMDLIDRVPDTPPTP